MYGKRPENKKRFTALGTACANLNQHYRATAGYGRLGSPKFAAAAEFGFGQPVNVDGDVNKQGTEQGAGGGNRRRVLSHIYITSARF